MISPALAVRLGVGDEAPADLRVARGDEQAQAAGYRWLHVDFDEPLRRFYSMRAALPDRCWPD